MVLSPPSIGKRKTANRLPSPYSSQPSAKIVMSRSMVLSAVLLRIEKSTQDKNSNLAPRITLEDWASGVIASASVE